MSDALELVLDPVNTCVRTIHQILLDASRSEPLGQSGKRLQAGACAAKQ